MEKICIARRRKQEFYQRGYSGMADGSSVLSADRYGLVRRGFFDSVIAEAEDAAMNDCGAGSSREKPAVSFPLTSEQARILSMDEMAERLKNDEPCEALLELMPKNDGTTTFNIYLGTLKNGKMLKTGQVCHMLQVSKSFLRRLIQARKLKSYKIGRLRRFSADDVLDYIARNEVSPAEDR